MSKIHKPIHKPTMATTFYIGAMVKERYDEVAGAYKGDHTDESIAKELSASIGITVVKSSVANMRRQLFGEFAASKNDSSWKERALRAEALAGHICQIVLTYFNSKTRSRMLKIKNNIDAQRAEEVHGSIQYVLRQIRSLDQHSSEQTDQHSSEPDIEYNHTKWDIFDGEKEENAKKS